MPEDLETGVCKRCGVDITFELDDPEADDNPLGLWYDDNGREACIPGPNDEDQYHEPSEEES